MDAEEYRTAWLAYADFLEKGGLTDQERERLDRDLYEIGEYCVKEGGNLLSFANVEGVGASLKLRDGRIQQEPSLTFFVSKKTDSLSLTGGIIPPVIEKWSTDVVDAGSGTLATGQGSAQGLMPNLSISSVGGSTTGTMGALVRDGSSGGPLLLTNEHVLDASRLGPGTPAIQPGASAGGSFPTHHVGHVDRYVGQGLGPNLADAAVVRPATQLPPTNGPWSGVRGT